jgi:WD40 repeat protein
MPAFNLDKFKSAKDISRSGAILSLARAPQRAHLFVGCADFKVCDIDVGQDKPEFKEIGSHASYVTGLALAGKTLVSGSYDGRLIWWNTESRSQIRAVDAHSKWIRDLAATRDGKIVASVADDMVCRLWEMASGKLLRELRGHQEKTPHHFPSMLHACAISPDGKAVATGDKVGHIVIWELSSGKQLTSVEVPEMYTWDPVQRRHSIGGIRGLAFSPDSRLLAVGGIGKIGNIDHLDGKARIEIFDWQKGERTHEFASDKLKGLVEDLKFFPDGELLLGAGGANDGFLIFYDVRGKKAVRQEKAPMHVHAVELNESGDTIYAAGHGRLVVFEMKS